MTDEDYVERATTFDGGDAPSGERLDGSESLQNYYDRLSVWNSLGWNGKWKDRNRETTKNTTAIVDAVAAQMELTDYQKAEAQRMFSNLPDRYNQARSTALLALCICAIVGVQDGRNYHPSQVKYNTADNIFVDIANEIEVSFSELYTCWRQLREEVE